MNSINTRTPILCCSVCTFLFLLSSMATMMTIVSRRLCRTNKLFLNGCRHFSPFASSSYSPSSSSRSLPSSESSQVELNRSVLGFRVVNSIHQPNLCCFSNLCRYTSQAGVDHQPVDGIVDIPLAQTGEGIAECELLKWFVQEGEQVEEFQPLCEVQSDKATIEITSRYKGKVLHILHASGDVVKVGETLLKMGVEEHSSETRSDGLSGVELNNAGSQGDSSSQESSDDGKRYGGVLCTPAVRNLAKQLGIDVNDVKGSGKDGRILKEDILNYVGRNVEVQPSAFSDSLPKLVSQSVQFEDKTIQLRGFQRAMVKSMTLAARIPHFHYVEEVKCDALVELKASFQNENSDPSIKHTFLPVMVKALSVALSTYPLLNSCFVEDLQEVIVKGSHNIGIAMATPYGLVVPNIKKVQSLSVMEITKEISRLQQLAMDNKLSQEDISDGTITVSNIGAIGGKFGSPLVNLPEVAIIALGRIQKVPHIADDGTVYPLPIMNVNIGADHRVLDGATVARFCNEWKSLIEKPERLLLQLR